MENFEKRWDSIRPALHRIANRRVDSVDDADELVSDTCLIMVERYRDTPFPFFGRYAVAVLAYLIGQYVKKLLREREMMAALCEDLERGAEDKEIESIVLWSPADKLPEVEKLIFVYKYLGYSNAEIASELEISQTTVRRLLAKSGPKFQ